MKYIKTLRGREHLHEPNERLFTIAHCILATPFVFAPREERLDGPPSVLCAQPSVIIPVPDRVREADQCVDKF
jgi:hypothetical protein